jgi:Domain of unknown function (DUF4352)
MRRSIHWTRSRTVGPALVALFVSSLVVAMDAQPSRATQAPKPCSATGVDPTKQAVHFSAKGTPKKLKKPENSGKLFGKARIDRQKEDQERNNGEVVRIAGFSTTVVSAGFEQSVGQFQDAGYLKANVKICNRNDDAQPYSYVHWRLQTPAGQVIDPTFVVGAPILGQASGLPSDLLKGAEATGDVYFQVGGEKGDFYLIYKPSPLDASRGIWKVTV